MKTKTKLLLAGLLACATPAFAQSTATTDPVGGITVTAANGSDTLFGLSLHQPAVYAGSPNGFASGGSRINLPANSFTNNAYNNTHFMLVTSGAIEGQWFEITNTNTDNLNFSGVNLPSLGMTASDTFKIIPFWTLSTLLPSGSGFPVSTNIAAPTARILVNNASAQGINLSAAELYFYHDGSMLAPAGWRDSSFALADDVPLNPETYITVRNESGSDADLIVAGAVPMSTISTQIGRLAASAQDNQVANPFPVPLVLSSSDLTDVVDVSTNIAAPTDLLLVFDGTESGLNPSPSKVYFYHDGSMLAPAGWRDNGFNLADTVEIPAGGAFIVRKADGPQGLADWTPTLPY